MQVVGTRGFGPIILRFFFLVPQLGPFFLQKNIGGEGEGGEGKILETFLLPISYLVVVLVVVVVVVVSRMNSFLSRGNIEEGSIK